MHLFRVTDVAMTDDVCGICLDQNSGPGVSVLTCAHKYHTTCIERWVNTGVPCCPTCRAAISYTGGIDWLSILCGFCLVLSFISAVTRASYFIVIHMIAVDESRLVTVVLISVMSIFLWMSDCMLAPMHLWNIMSHFTESCGGDALRYNVSWGNAMFEVTNNELCAYEVFLGATPLLLSISLGLYVWRLCRGAPTKRLQ